jgi:methylamine dehydrogenase accessory protein MauD
VAALPVIEIAVAAALIPVASGWWGAVAALALLVVVTAGVAVTLLTGRRPDCHCFGQLYSAPIGWGTLVRNGVMIALAAFVVSRGEAGASVIAVAENAAAAGSMLWLATGLAVAIPALCVETWLLIEVVRQQGWILLRLDALETRSGVPDAAAAAESRPGLPVGQSAPAFTLPGLYGETMTLDALRTRGKPLLLLFTDPNCGPCEALVPDLARGQKAYESVATLAVISRGKPEENRAKLGAHGLNLVLLQKDREVSLSYRAVGTPSAVLLHPDGTIASTLAQGPMRSKG